jgi:ATP-dependent Clp endopeptidase proteolytic subunit ClpP
MCVAHGNERSAIKRYPLIFYKKMSDCEDAEEQSVYSEGDTVYFFCDVDDYTVRKMCILLKKVSQVHHKIKLCINSNGGGIYAGFAGMDYIRSIVLQGNVVETVVCGMCASAATFLLLGGSKRSMGANSYVLIHQMSDSLDGTFGELQCSMKNNKKYMKHLRRMYLENTKIPEEYLEKMLSRDIVLSSKKCIKYGVVDNIF